MHHVSWPDFYFARHGETNWNRERRYQGSRDIPLNETGRKQADSNGVLLRFLLEEAGADPASFKWYASPLSRARETIERMRAAFDIALPDVIYDERLVEISFGKFEGLLHEEIARERNEALAPGQRDASYWHFRPDEGENYEDVAQRLLDFATELTDHSIIVAHGGVLRVLRHLVEGADRAEVLNWEAPQGVIAHFEGKAMTLHAAQKDMVDDNPLTRPGPAHPEITDAGIADLISIFYDRAREDDVIGPIFNRVVHDWPEHIAQITNFWSSIMLRTGRYSGRPLNPHLRLPLEDAHFDRWLALFEETALELFTPEIAHEFMIRARRIADNFELAIGNMRGEMRSPRHSR